MPFTKHLKLNAAILNPNQIFERTNPRIGISSTRYRRRITDGMPSTAERELLIGDIPWYPFWPEFDHCDNAFR